MTSSAYLREWGCHRRRLIHFLSRPTVRPLRDQNIFLIQENENFLYQASKADFPVKTFEVWESSNKQSTEKLTLIYQGVKRVNQSWQRHAPSRWNRPRRLLHALSLRPLSLPTMPVSTPPATCSTLKTNQNKFFSGPPCSVGECKEQGTEGVYSIELVIALTQDQPWQDGLMFRCVQCWMLNVVCCV